MGFICIMYVRMIFKINWDIVELSLICEHQEWSSQLKDSDFAENKNKKKDGTKFKTIYDCNAVIRRSGLRNSLAFLKLDNMIIEMFKTFKI